MQWPDLFMRLRRLTEKQETDNAVLQGEISDLRNEVDGFKVTFAEFRNEVAEIKSTVEHFVGSFEAQLTQLAKRGAGAKDRADRELKLLRRDLDSYIEVVEKLVVGQMDAERRRELSRLITSARKKRTRIENEIKRRAANDG